MFLLVFYTNKQMLQNPSLSYKKDNIFLINSIFIAYSIPQIIIM